MKLTVAQRAVLIVVLLAAAAVQGRGCRLPLPETAKATAATYIYEKDQHTIPSPVLVALNKLNRAGLVATTHEVDSTDGTGEVPDQYKVPVEAAKQAGLPALVVTADKKVLRVVKDPKTEEQVLEAVK